MYSIRSIVRSGNSGGPLLSMSGTVLGVVFATDLRSSDTGYVLTAHEVAADYAGRAGRHGAGRHRQLHARTEPSAQPDLAQRTSSPLIVSGTSLCGKCPTPSSTRHS